MDVTKRAMMNLSGLDFPGFFERISRLLARGVFGAARTIRRWNHNQKTRRALLTMSDHMLRDIGISRVDALREGRKAFWQN